MKKTTPLLIVILILLRHSFSQGAYSGDDPRYESGAIDKQAMECTKVLNSPCCSNDVDYFNCGNTHYAQKEYDKAIKDYTKAIELNPRNAIAYGGRGNTYYMKRIYDQAIADFTKAVALDPMNAFLYTIRGNVYDDKGLYEMAIADYTKAIDLNPNFAVAYSERGVAKTRKGSYDEAMTDFAKAISVDPKLVDAYKGRGSAQYIKGSYTQAMSDFIKIFDLDPEYEYAYLRLVISIWLSNGNDKDAVDRLRQHVSSHSSNEWIRTISKYYLGIDGLTEQLVLAEANKGSDDGARMERLCEAYYYLAGC